MRTARPPLDRRARSWCRRPLVAARGSFHSTPLHTYERVRATAGTVNVSNMYTCLLRSSGTFRQLEMFNEFRTLEIMEKHGSSKQSENFWSNFQTGPLGNAQLPFPKNRPLFQQRHMYLYTLSTFRKCEHGIAIHKAIGGTHQANVNLPSAKIHCVHSDTDVTYVN